MKIANEESIFPPFRSQERRTGGRCAIGDGHGLEDTVDMDVGDGYEGRRCRQLSTILERTLMRGPLLKGDADDGVFAALLGCGGGGGVEAEEAAKAAVV